MADVRHRLEAALSGRYQVHGEIGSGGMGTVYVADDLKHDRRVAIKVLSPRTAEQIGTNRFHQEIRIAASLNHPHIVALHDSGEADGLLYYVMPLIDGRSVADLIAAGGPLPTETALTIARDIATGLAHAHARGVVHRDVKPSNILISGGHAVLADFGTAHLDPAGAEDSLTKSGEFLGTPRYMSPEQVSDAQNTDHRADLYSLGAVLFEALTGEPACKGSQPYSVVAMHADDSVPSVRKVRPAVPRSVARVVDRALATDPGDRFQSARDMARAIQHALAEVKGEPFGWMGRVPPRWRRVATAGLALGLGFLFLRAYDLIPGLGPSGVAGLTDQAGSVVVVPVRGPSTTPEEEALIVDLSGEITRQLNAWDSIRAVPQMSLSGIAFDLGIDPPPVSQIQEALRIAEATGVEQMLSVNVEIRPDETAHLAALLLDARRGTSIGPELQARGRPDDIASMAAQVVHGVLGLEGPVDEIEELRSQSPHVEAVRSFREGLALLERWRLPEARAAFRDAVERDPEFANALHHLALSLYWDIGRSSGSNLLAVGPQITQYTTRAFVNAEGLPERDRSHITAFHRFMSGDYEEARTRYARLVERDSTDVFALILQGAVEYRDPWLTVGPGGDLVPRSDLNTALHAFRRTVDLSPGFHLGYGHLFDITEMVLEGAGPAGTARGFMQPSGDRIAPWEEVTPFDMAAFHPVFLDSMRWIPASRWASLDHASAVRGATDLLDQSMRSLRRWADWAPEEPRPLRELGHWTLRRREQLAGTLERAAADSLAGEALEFESRALALQGDTTAGDWFRMASFRLAAGDDPGAVEAVERGLLGLEGAQEPGDVPSNALNPLLATGRASRAIELASQVDMSARYPTDPETGRPFGDPAVGPHVSRVAVLGALGVTGDPVQREFDAIEARWPAAEYSGTQRRLLHRVYLFDAWPALLDSPLRMASWQQVTGGTDPIWRVLGQSSDQATAAYADALHYPRPEVQGPLRELTLGSAAAKLGRNESALDHLTRVLETVPSAQARDRLWGLQHRARLLRGEVLLALGRTGPARDDFQVFLDAWADDDPLTEELRERARRGLASIPPL
jgi:tetratricopeptide (TPR) repeat protein